jgi:hypothetical protein
MTPERIVELKHALDVAGTFLRSRLRGVAKDIGQSAAS